ncbi:MAG: hypothetical protein FWD47_11150 [Treponema sp.]|nr:hypothetical protein [Treponema sp.]
MKKLLFVLILAAIITTGTAFADHPNGLGIGVQTGTFGTWSGYGGYTPNVALSLKVPSLPVFWAIRLDIYDGYFGLNVAGDYYLIDNVLVRDIGLHWYLGVGVGVNLGISDPLIFGAAVRLPIGLSWQPIPLLELFLQLVPNLGLQVLPSVHFPYGGWGGDFGIRLWL